MATTNERVAILEQRVQDIAADVEAILVLIQGPPREDSLRGRLHFLESSNAAAAAAEAALTTAKALSAERSLRVWTRTEKFFGAAVSVAVVSTPYVMFFFAHSGG